MGASVKQDNAPIGCGVDSGLHSVKIQALCVLGEVGVDSGGEADIVEDLLVVGPGWVAEVDRRVPWEEFGEKEAA